jgi:23S rRNA (uracil1939-C5)-methyltransferase
MSDVLTIADVGHRGDGVAHTADGAVFVPYTLPGETVSVEADRALDRRRLIAIHTLSPRRVAPICPHFGSCGGCSLQHWASDAYRGWKRSLVVAALGQAGIDAPADDLIDAHGEGRRRVVLHARFDNSRLEVGFSMARAHTIVPIQACPVLAPSLQGALAAARALAASLRSIRKPLDIQVTATDAGLDIDLRGSGALTREAEAALTAAAASRRLARLTRHGHRVMQVYEPTIRMGRAAVTLPPGAFLQATQEGEEVLARLVGKHTNGASHILDLFAGVGPFALRLAETAQVHAVDSDARAIDALRNAAQAPGLRPVTVETRDLFRLPLRVEELRRYDAVVFDPPRQGATAQTREIAASRVPRVVAVSCNPATFARDARTLIDSGYRLERVTPVDQFRYSAHVEVVGLFRR